MENITHRTNYYTEEIIDGIKEYNLASLNFGNFDFGEDEYYLVKYNEIGRPDIISQNIYGTTNYWWFIMWYNGISDVWNDIRDGLVLKYPNIEMVRKAIKNYNQL